MFITFMLILTDIVYTLFKEETDKSQLLLNFNVQKPVYRRTHTFMFNLTDILYILFQEETEKL